MENDSITMNLEPSWNFPAPGVIWRSVIVYLVPEKDGGFSAIAPELPGTGSQGETEEESLANVKEAIGGAIACYRDGGGAVPWTTPEPPEWGWLIRRVTVEMPDVPT